MNDLTDMNNDKLPILEWELFRLDIENTYKLHGEEIEKQCAAVGAPYEPIVDTAQELFMHVIYDYALQKKGGKPMHGVGLDWRLAEA